MSFMKNLVEKTQQVADAAQRESDQFFQELVKVPAEVRDHRMSVCNSCEHLSEKLHRCALCGCFMELKTWLPTQKCPIDKWAPHVIATDSDEP